MTIDNEFAETEAVNEVLVAEETELAVEAEVIDAVVAVEDVVLDEVIADDEDDEPEIIILSPYDRPGRWYVLGVREQGQGQP